MKLIVLFSFLTTFCVAQNLIYNGDFEIYIECPNNYSQIDRAERWKMPGGGTSDYFNSCSKSKICSVPKNFRGNAYAKSGNAYAGIGLFLNVDVGYEFIQTEFDSKLKKHNNYCLTFYVYKSNSSNVDYSSFSAIISEKKIKMEKSNFIDKRYCNINTFLKTTLINNNKEKEWQKICFKFNAFGGEKYLIIGYDKYPDSLLIKNSKDKTTKKELYYYIDDVSLVEIKDSSECACNEVKPIKKDSVKVEIVKSYYDSADVKAFVLNNLVFESNKSKLMPASNTELDKLVNYLKTNPTKTIELFGYTDNTGKELDNLKLSEARVKSVADYLISKGIEAKRITFKGYGSKNLIKPNDTELNKAKNRRVEFKIK